MPYAVLAMLLAAGPLLLFSSALWPIGAAFALVAIGLSIAVRWNQDVSGDERAVLFLLLLSIVSAIVISPNWFTSLPRVLGLLFATTIFLAVRAFVRTIEQTTVAFALLSCAGLAVGLLGLVGTDWRVEYAKVALFLPLYDRIPRLLSSVTSSQGTIPGFHPNEVAAICAVLVPVALATALLAWKRIVTRKQYGNLLGILALASIAVLSMYLILSVSRAAWLGLALGLAVAAFVYGRRYGLLLVAVLGIAAVALWVWVGRSIDLSGLLTTTDFLWTAESWGRPTRYQMWGRGLMLIAEHPLLGIGPNMFPILAGFELTEPGSVPHAHNMFIQVALDFGLPGLGIFGYMLLAALKGVRVISATANPRRLLCAGLVGSIVTYCVFGLVDAVAVGAKPTFIPWAVLALAVSLRQSKPSSLVLASKPDRRNSHEVDSA